MKKYDLETKLKIIKAYDEGCIGTKELARIYGTTRTSVKNWIHTYHSMGIDGLKEVTRPQSYSFEFKRNVVKSYLEGNLSYRDIADKFKIRSPSIPKGWVNIYKKRGLEGLLPPKGDETNMLNPTNEENNNRASTSSEEELERLKKENQTLKIQLEFAKKKLKWLQMHN